MQRFTHQMCNNITVTASLELVVGQTLPEIFMVVDLSIHLVFNTYLRQTQFKNPNYD